MPPRLTNRDLRSTFQLLTMKLSPAQSLAGILEPVFAIRTEEDLGIGDTDGVRQMIDWCHRHQLNILQTLPINEISDDNSPYNALSSLAIEPATLAVSPRARPRPAGGKVSGAGPPGVAGRIAQRAGPVSQGQGAQAEAARSRLRELPRAAVQSRDRARAAIPLVPAGKRRMAFRLRAVPRADGGEWRLARVGPLGARTSRAAPPPARGCCLSRRNAATG